MIPYLMAEEAESARSFKSLCDEINISYPTSAEDWSLWWFEEGDTSYESG